MMVNSYRISQRDLKLGMKVILAGEAIRIIERWLHTINLRFHFPDFAMSRFPSDLPIELWATPWPELSTLIGAILLLIAYKDWKWKPLGFFLLLVFNILTAFGGSAIGKSFILLQPALLTCFILTLTHAHDGKNKKLNWEGFLVISLMATMYGMNAFAKSGSEWTDGLAMGKYLTSNLWAVGLKQEPIGIFWKLVTWGTLLWEGLGLILLIPFKYELHRKIRWVYGSIAILFHLILMILGPFHALGIVAIGMWIIILPREKLNTASEEPRGMKWVALVWILWILVSNLSLFGHATPDILKNSLNKVALNVQWRLFAPSPASDRVMVEFKSNKNSLIVTKYGSMMSFLLDVSKFNPLWERLAQTSCSQQGESITLKVYRNEKLDRERNYQCN